MVLSDREKEIQLKAIENQRTVKLAELRTREALNDVNHIRFAVEELESIDKQIVELKHQLSLLSISAPESGVVVAPPLSSRA